MFTKNESTQNYNITLIVPTQTANTTESVKFTEKPTYIGLHFVKISTLIAIQVCYQLHVITNNFATSQKHNIAC